MDKQTNLSRTTYNRNSRIPEQVAGQVQVRDYLEWNARWITAHLAIRAGEHLLAIEQTFLLEDLKK